MGVKQCENGHYYNDEKYKRCPHCDHNSAFQKNHAYTDLEARGMADSVGFADVKPVAAPVPEVYTASVPAEDAETHVRHILHRRQQDGPGAKVYVAYLHRMQI